MLWIIVTSRSCVERAWIVKEFGEGCGAGRGERCRLFSPQSGRSTQKLVGSLYNGRHSRLT